MHFENRRVRLLTVLHVGKHLFSTMKWKRLATEFLPEKTFLIIRDDLTSLGAKENSIRRAKLKSALDTGTWPPKLKNSNHRHRRPSVAGERPKTANLEGPSVLDPRLLNKLDMSLVRKELLCDSMTRINQSVKSRVGGGITRNSTSDGSRRRQSVPIGEKSYTFASRTSGKQTSDTVFDEDKPDKGTISLPTVITIGSKKLSSFEQWSLSDCGRGKRDISSDLSSMKKQSGRRQNISSGGSQGSFANRRNSEAKRLDDNNNKNSNTSGNNNDPTITKICPLTSVKKNKTSKLGVSTEIEVFTGAPTKSAPEPCKTCGRPDQPERFHSHPKSSSLTVKKDKDVSSNGMSKIAVPKTVQKPVALNFRSDKSKRNKEWEKKWIVASPMERKSRNTSPRDSKSEKNRKAPLNPSRKGPKSVTCYICAREFGSASFPIHEPKCMQKWERENNSLSVSQRRAVPQKPAFPVDHYDWNTAAWEQSQDQLVPCWKCSRTYLPERVGAHEKNCKSTRMIESFRNSTATDQPHNRVDTVSHTVPATVLCQICGRNFSTRSIKVHEPHCMKKWQAGNESLPSNNVKKPLRRVERSADVSSRELASIASPVRFSSPQKPTSTCYICERDFGSASIEIHEPQCLKKWQNENSKLPAHERRDEPQKSNIIYKSETPSGKPIVDWGATSEALWNSHLGQLVPCRHCKRTFNPDRVAVHERSCNGKR